jgi:hypothetical protein
MRKRTFGRWATLLAVVAALGVGGFVAGLEGGDVSSPHTLADISWNLCDISWN